jgi:methyltransferase
MLERGGVETAQMQFPLIALAQLGWLASLGAFVPPFTPPNWWLLGAAAAVEVFHTWCIVTLGPFWTTRVIVVPGASLVRRGPYSLFRHPNYLAVLLEIVLLPLAFGAYAIAIVFSILYAALIFWRLRDEERLLATASNGSRPNPA